MNKNIPNAISLFRAILCVVMIVLPTDIMETMGTTFIILYIVAFVTDIIDGNLARLTNTTSELGTKLDSFADLLFFILMVVKIVPWVFEQMEIWVCWALIICLAVVLIARLLSSLNCRHKTGSFTPIHSIPNKIVSFLVFFFPFLFLVVKEWAILIIAVVAIYAAIDEVIKVSRYANEHTIDKQSASD